MTSKALYYALFGFGSGLVLGCLQLPGYDEGSFGRTGLPYRHFASRPDFLSILLCRLQYTLLLLHRGINFKTTFLAHSGRDKYSRLEYLHSNHAGAGLEPALLPYQ